MLLLALQVARAKIRPGDTVAILPKSIDCTEVGVQASLNAITHGLVDQCRKWYIIKIISCLIGSYMHPTKVKSSILVMLASLLTSHLMLLYATPSYAQGVFSSCGSSTVLSGFKFSLTCNNNSNLITITNTYNREKKLAVKGNFIKVNESIHHDSNTSVSILTFPKRASLVIKVDDVGSGDGYGGGGYGFTTFPATMHSKLIQTVPVTCSGGTEELMGYTITPICDGKNSNFVVENTNKAESERKVVGYRGFINEVGIANYTTLSRGRQYKFNVSSVDNKSGSLDQKYQIEFRNMPLPGSSRHFF